MHSSQRQIYRQVILHCSGDLNGYIAYFAPLPEREREHGLSGVHRAHAAEVRAQGRCALSAATVLDSRIHICGIIIEDKYYQVQSERVLCICAGAKKRGAVKPNTSPAHDTGELNGAIALFGPPEVSGATEVKGQGRHSFPQLRLDIMDYSYYSL